MNTELLTHHPKLNSTSEINNKIVFYIRALFKDSIPYEFKHASKMAKYVEYFNKHSKISMQDYRQSVHEIQKECLSKISNRFIYNLTQRGYPYNTIQPNTQNEISQLSDDDIVIPLDDDDWLSPEIKNLNFSRQGLTIWNSLIIDVHLERPHLCKKNIELPDILSEEDVKLANGLLSNCAAIPASLLKRMFQIKYTDGNSFLQRHILPRIIIRQSDYKDFNIIERIYSNYFAIYVKHAGNMTMLDRENMSVIDTPEFFEKKIKIYKNANYHAVNSMSEEYAWCKPYYKKLEQLNELL